LFDTSQTKIVIFSPLLAVSMTIPFVVNLT
jgi:hypothetical protein